MPKSTSIAEDSESDTDIDTSLHLDTSIKIANLMSFKDSRASRMLQQFLNYDELGSEKRESLYASVDFILTD